MDRPTIDLSGRAALVTGASRGIGRAVAELFAGAGARVGVHCVRGREAAENVRAGLPGRGHALLQADLGDPSRARALADEAVAALGRLDIVVNNAGIFESHPPGAMDAVAWHTAWDRHLAVNLSGPAHLIHAAIPHLETAGGGHVVNVTSRGAFRGEPDAPAYGAAKAGLNSLSQSLAVALAPRGIHVVAVAPGWVETDMTRAHLEGPGGEAIRDQSPAKRTATVDEIAWAILLAVSGRCDALTGGILDVNVASYLRS